MICLLLFLKKGDFQWIHIDVERASNESPFGGYFLFLFF